MGHVEPVQIGELRKTGQRRDLKRIWTAPCHDWSKQEQMLFMDEMGLPVNRIKVATGMSGECFCGCFASEGELDCIREHAPEVGQEIDRLAVIARKAGKPCVWGVRPTKGLQVTPTGPMCSSCDRRAASLGIQVVTALQGSQSHQSQEHRTA